MAREIKLSWVISICCWMLLGPFQAQAGQNDMVPVLLWAGSSSNNLANPLQKTSKVEFENILNKNVGKELPPIVVFVKDNFCVEDITRNKKSLQQLTKSGNLIYLTAVESALSVFENLPNYNVSVEETIETVSDGHLVIVELADLDAVPEIYDMVKESSGNLIVAVTGKSCGFANSERIKRSKRQATPIAEEPIIISKDRVLFYAEKVLAKSKGETKYNKLGKPNVESISIDKGLRLNMTFDKFRVCFEFVDTGRQYFVLNRTIYHVNGEQEGNEKILRSSHDIYFPHNSSYHCTNGSVFTDREIFVKFENLQVQVGEGNVLKFGDAWDCTGYTSIPIWSGVFVTAILAIIMIWGLSMIMDIRTMDRFDDPKGKTITITSTD